MQIFDEIKNREVEDVLFLSMDRVSGLEEGVKVVFPNAAVQRCMVPPYPQLHKICAE